MQFLDECAARLGMTDVMSPTGFAAFLAAMQTAQGEDVILDGPRITQRGWKLMRGIDLGGDESALAAFDAWNGLWAGALAAGDRFLQLETRRARDDGGDWTIEWRVRA
jgi:hypothetical protein